MEIDIRKSIIENFKGASSDEIKQSIVSSTESNEEITLPGLGVFFEILWKNSDENSKEYILNTLKENIN
ncbi:MAG: small acid-soluble spore protein SspI [Bacilli bacterium]|nr:small acid-soluble spore protein SspI [Bacilli bacterium]MDD4547488.1 small acid-soluble spore protein SspI [Bacilli bacterium]